MYIFIFYIKGFFYILNMHFWNGFQGNIICVYIVKRL